MSTIALETLRAHLRAEDDLDATLQLALDAAEAEAAAYLGRPLAEMTDAGGALPSDVTMAVLLLAQTYVDDDDPRAAEARRGAAQRLLLPYRIASGIGGG